MKYFAAKSLMLPLIVRCFQNVKWCILGLCCELNIATGPL